jgi:hypothetical protein
MALRAKWGKESQFLISIGGFHPAYPPPKNVPDLTRLTVALDIPGGTPTVTFKGYMAVTSNTFQVGAKIHAEIDKGKLFVSGTLGFDALFQFSPFKFRFDFLVQFRVEIGKFKLGAGIDGTVTGPSPMRIRGKAHLNPPGLPKMTAKFDVTLGKDSGSSELPAAEVVPPLVDALTHEKNWTAQLPADGEGPVSLQGAGKRAKKAAKGGGSQGGGSDDGPMRAHPLGTLTVTQGVVPFGYTIEKFGESSPGTYNRFAITDVAVGGETGDVVHESVSGEFAPAKYKKMGTKEKLNSKDFVQREAGTTVGTSEVFAGGETTSENAAHARFIYEEQVYDRERGDHGQDVAGKHAKQGHTEHVAKRQTKGKASAQTETKGRFSVDEDGIGGGAGGGASGGIFGTGNREFVVVDPDTFERVDRGLVDGLIASSGGGEGGTGTASQPQDYRTDEDGAFGATDSDDGVFGPESGGIDGERGLPRNVAEDARREIAAGMGRDPADLSVVALEEYDGGRGE